MHPIRSILLVLLAVVAWAAEPVRVCVTTTDLGDLLRLVGGEDIEVTVFARGGDDPHLVEPRPSFAKALSRADLVVSVGMELEIGWLPTVVTQARNPRLASGQPGCFEAASAIVPLGVPTAPIDRSHGHVHAAGNPHFLSDPVCGVQVARALARRLAQLRPDMGAACTARYRAFALEVARRLLGQALVQRAGDDRAIAALENDHLPALIGDGADLGGWLGRIRPIAGARLVADHDLWPYLARRLGVQVVGFLEPLPGVPPTSRHLAGLIDLAKSQGVKAVITVPYFDQRSSGFVGEQLGIPVVVLAHQVGAIGEAGDWLTMLDLNVGRLADALNAPR
jgi:ABC-type Zn uptake system ZnuABC Zn-binding protein ZnuA